MISTLYIETVNKVAWARPARMGQLARISHQLKAEARDRPAIIVLRLLAVLNVLFKYASARRAARALYRRASHALRLATW